MIFPWHFFQENRAWHPAIKAIRAKAAPAEASPRWTRSANAKSRAKADARRTKRAPPTSSRRKRRARPAARADRRAAKAIGPGAAAATAAAVEASRLPAWRAHRARFFRTRALVAYGVASPPLAARTAAARCRRPLARGHRSRPG